MPKKIKVVFMGTPEFALPSLLSLIDAPDIEIQAVVTREDKKVGRKQILTSPPVKLLALEKGIPVLQPPTFKGNTEISEVLKGLKPDFLVVIAYGHILPSEILEIPKYASVNIHGSLLPRYRGASPIEESILNNDQETGISFIKMIKKMDAGPVYSLHRLTITPEDTALTLRAKLALMAGNLIPFVLNDIIQNEMEPIPQNNAIATYCKKISKEDGIVDLKSYSAIEIINKIKAYSPWPGCFIRLDNKKLTLISAEALSDSSVNPGELIEIEKGKMGIGTKNGIIIPMEIQMEGKKPMKFQDFLLGNKDLLIKLLESAK